MIMIDDDAFMEYLLKIKMMDNILYLYTCARLLVHVKCKYTLYRI